jgi:hypothetical protein
MGWQDSQYALRMGLPHFSKVFDLVSIPTDWELVSLSADWFGRPLLLFREGKPPQPDVHHDREAWSRWYRTPPKAHHVVYQEAGQLRSVAFDHSRGISTFHVQRFGNGWLLAESRGGHASFYDASGALHSAVELGDAIESVQTTTNGRIWVSYFDEGVFGGGIGRQGLVCFDSSGKTVFKYGDFAEQNNLPMICDCYALNVDMSGDVWLNYYTDFPLVRLHEQKVESIWAEFGALGNAFAVRDNEIIYMAESQLTAISVATELRGEPLSAMPRDVQGVELAVSPQRGADTAGRDSAFIINTGDAIYSTGVSDQSS